MARRSTTSTEGFFQRILQVEKSGKVGFRAWFELDQQVGVAALRVEVNAAGGRAEDLQPPDMEALA